MTKRTSPEVSTRLAFVLAVPMFFVLGSIVLASIPAAVLIAIAALVIRKGVQISRSNDSYFRGFTLRNWRKSEKNVPASEGKNENNLTNDVNAILSEHNLQSQHNHNSQSEHKRNSQSEHKRNSQSEQKHNSQSEHKRNSQQWQHEHNPHEFIPDKLATNADPIPYASVASALRDAGESKRARDAAAGGSDSEDEADALSTLDQMTRSTGKVIAPKSSLLTAQDSTAQRIKDVTVGHNRNGGVNCVKFHPSKPILVTACEAGMVKLFELCESTENPRLKSGDFFLQDTKFRCKVGSIDFFNDGLSLFVVPLNQNYCYTYDLVRGKVSQIDMPKNSVKANICMSKATLSADGTFAAFLLGMIDVHVFVLSTMEHLHTFRAEAPIVDFCFSVSNRNILYALAANGAVYLWNLARKAEQTRFYDDGCVRATKLALSHNEQFIACGSNTGIVNVYEASSAWYPPTAAAAVFTSEEEQTGPTTDVTEERTVRPLYTLTNLTTSASFLAFNHDAQLMAFGSNDKKMSARLLHCRSGGVYQNFPARQEMFAKETLNCAAFSPNSAFMALGNAAGYTRLYRLHHFSTY